MYKKLMTFTFLGVLSLISSVYAQVGEPKCADSTQVNNKLYTHYRDLYGCPRFVEGDEQSKKCIEGSLIKAGCKVLSK